MAACDNEHDSDAEGGQHPQSATEPDISLWRLLRTFATPDAELAPLSAPPAEWVHALPPAQPALLAVSLVLRDDGGLDFEPPLAEVDQPYP